MLNSKLFGNRLKKERKDRALTVQTIADACGTSRSYITLIENGKRLPGKKILPKIANVLQIEKAKVLEWYLEHVSHKVQAHMQIED